MRTLILALMLPLLAAMPADTLNSDSRAAKPAVIPRPMVMKVSRGTFILGLETLILVEIGEGDVRAVGYYLSERLAVALNRNLPVRGTPSREGVRRAILLTTAGADPDLGDEGYELTVTKESVTLRAPTATGLFRGVQTIRQLLPPEFEAGEARNEWRLPCLYVKDKPRYRWRGLLLDTCRHFMTKEFIKRYIDLLAYHKMNVLHWHLTEDQGWRIEIKRYPKLTEIGAWRGEGDARYGGFYSQEDIKEVVAYAQSRHIMVVPEIEMPGHSQAALAAYPDLSCTGGPFEVGTRWGVYSDVYCAGNEKVFEFLEGVLSEVVALFPAQYIHIGGDECPKSRWEECEKCQARIREDDLADEHELQSYFIKRIEGILKRKNRTLIGWDEILEGGLAPSATVQSWRGMSGAIEAATMGHDVISSPTSHCYLDYSHDSISLEKIYSFDPTPPELTPEQAKHILGGEGNMWTEHAPQERVDRQVFPRLCGLAEALWSPAELRNWSDFSRRMKTHYRRLNSLGVNYFIPPPTVLSLDNVFLDEATVLFEDAGPSAEIRYTLDGSDPTRASLLYTGPFRLNESATVTAVLVREGGRMSEPIRMDFLKQTLRPPDPAGDLAPGLKYRYFEGHWTELPHLEDMQPSTTGTAETLGIALRERDEGFAMEFTGHIGVPADGIYTFYTDSDDGSRLYIGSTLVVQNDGLHAPRERRGQIALKAGAHPIRVTMFQAGGDLRLVVSHAGPGFAKQTVPSSVLFHKK
ncbi:MAG: family 20 glycosylhydrolase [Armatimonadetes bacterium]|nr:family 20 glycosylhydrolase [Armatimonadota bacterium]